MQQCVTKGFENIRSCHNRSFAHCTSWVFHCLRYHQHNLCSVHRFTFIIYIFHKNPLKIAKYGWLKCVKLKTQKKQITYRIGDKREEWYNAKRLTSFSDSHALIQFFDSKSPIKLWVFK